MEIITQKKCIRCGNIKKIEDFYVRTASNDGRAVWCKTCSNIYDKEYAVKHKEIVGRKNKKWRDGNKEKIKNAWHNMYLKCKSIFLERGNQWRNNNKDRANRRNREWKSKNLEKLRIANQNRRAVKKQSFGKISKDEWEKVVALHDGKCACCGDKTKMTIDHVMPLALGGSNEIENIQPLCQGCNSRKGKKNIDYRK